MGIPSRGLIKAARKEARELSRGTRGPRLTRLTMCCLRRSIADSKRTRFAWGPKAARPLGRIPISCGWLCAQVLAPRGRFFLQVDSPGASTLAVTADELALPN